ncbi:hypothetical protein PHET_09704 [Paragonimus heterotremus]|uniref:Uncharacterized protein n=1 Tax=Paragonimus heterotremus TaxID=100268 RepID=A0A8J4WER3_9TREM|nr:hypothetical protein PHET_09704 [Paragonimus heterotremus]
MMLVVCPKRTSKWLSLLMKLPCNTVLILLSNRSLEVWCCPQCTCCGP